MVVKNIRMDKKDVLLRVEIGMREVTSGNTCVYRRDEYQRSVKRSVPLNL